MPESFKVKAVDGKIFDVHQEDQGETLRTAEGYQLTPVEGTSDVYRIIELGGLFVTKV